MRKYYIDEKAIKRKTNGYCYYCGIKLTKQKAENHKSDNFTIDHKKPKALDGTNHYKNLVPCCRKCNNLKGMNDIEGFRWIMIKKRFEKENGIQFTDEQFKWLENNGFKIKFPKHKFYFELNPLLKGN